MTERKPVVDLSEELTHVGRVFRLHLPLEPVHLVHVLALVVAARHEEALRVEQLEAEEDEDALDGEGAPVHEVAVEEVGVVPRRQAVQLEYVEQVVELKRQNSGEHESFKVIQALNRVH